MWVVGRGVIMEIRLPVFKRKGRRELCAEKITLLLEVNRKFVSDSPIRPPHIGLIKEYKNTVTALSFWRKQLVVFFVRQVGHDWKTVWRYCTCHTGPRHDVVCFVITVRSVENVVCGFPLLLKYIRITIKMKTKKRTLILLFYRAINGVVKRRCTIILCG